jgi:hypothetical protein
MDAARHAGIVELGAEVCNAQRKQQCAAARPADLDDAE